MRCAEKARAANELLRKNCLRDNPGTTSFSALVIV
jgi:hypothetical protein